MSPETQTFVSTATRSACLSHGAYCQGDVALDGLVRSPELCRYLCPVPKERVEAPLPLVLADDADALPIEPGIDGLADERGDGNAPPLAETPERFDLSLVEIDVCPSHRPYIIHHLHTSLPALLAPGLGSIPRLRYRP
jgi:hypothetical protein